MYLNSYLIISIKYIQLMPCQLYKYNGSLGFIVKRGRIWGCERAYARSHPQIRVSTTASSRSERRKFPKSQYNQAMAQIEVKKLHHLPEGRFEVTVRSNTVTKHNVTVTEEYYEKLTAGAVSPEALVEKSFEFLLAREPNTSILSEFNLRVISKYFPEYEREIKSKFQSGI